MCLPSKMVGGGSLKEHIILGTSPSIQQLDKLDKERGWHENSNQQWRWDWAGNWCCWLGKMLAAYVLAWLGHGARHMCANGWA